MNDERSRRRLLRMTRRILGAMLAVGVALAGAAGAQETTKAIFAGVCFWFVKPSFDMSLRGGK